EPGRGREDRWGGSGRDFLERHAALDHAGGDVCGGDKHDRVISTLRAALHVAAKQRRRLWSEEQRADGRRLLVQVRIRSTGLGKGRSGRVAADVDYPDDQPGADSSIRDSQERCVNFVHVILLVMAIVFIVLWLISPKIGMTYARFAVLAIAG